MEDYRVNLDIYNGPMDLLLYLIRRDELDIHDIPISKITAQYCAHVEVLKRIDPDLAGEFLVMAATLMEIKTRMLLPRGQEGAEGEEDFDPRADLVQQLLQYKAFKDAAEDLRLAAAEQALRFPRRPGQPEAEEDGKDIQEVQIWDLVSAFDELMRATGQNLRETEIVYDDTPIELHAADLLDRLARDGNMTFAEIFRGRTRRTELVGLFLALLELIRRRQVFVEQQTPFGEIYVFLCPATPAGEADGSQQAQEASDAPAERDSSPAAGDSQLTGQTEEGRYISQSPPTQKDDVDDSGSQTQGDGS